MARRGREGEAWSGGRGVVGKVKRGREGEAWPGGRGSVRAARRNKLKHGNRERVPSLT